LSDSERSDTEDHGADVLGGGRFEEVSTTAGAVADVVADEVSDDARVARVVLGDARLDLADEVGPDVGCLRVDAAAQLGEQRHERCPETEADDQEGRLGDGDVGDERRVEREDAPHAEERQRDDEEARNGTTPHRHLDGLDEASSSSGGGPDVRANADEHADDPGRHRADGADEEGDRGEDADRCAGELPHVGDVRCLDDGDHDADDHGADDRERRDGRVLAPDECVRALPDRAGDGLHLRRPGVARQHVAGKVQREEYGCDPGDRDQQLERTRIHQGRRVLHWEM
jgi:hypothetical protein